MSGAKMAKVPSTDVQAQALGSAMEAANVAEDEAKLYYGIWAHRVRGIPPAWEHLDEREREGWRNVVLYVKSEYNCGTGLMRIEEIGGLLAGLDSPEDDDEDDDDDDPLLASDQN